MKRIFTFPLLLSISIAFGQPPQKLWDRFFNGNLAGKDISNAVITDASNNVFITGLSYHLSSSGSFTTIKYDPAGVQQWTDHYYGSSPVGKSMGSEILIDKWQNVYALGTVALNFGDIGIVKYNQSGKVWSKNYEPYYLSSDVDAGVDIAIDSSGFIYGCGKVTSLAGNLADLYTFKCDSSGTVLEDENFSSASGDDFPAGIDVTPSGNFFALTNSFNFFGSITYDIFTINFLSNWSHNWESKYNGPGNGFDYGTFIKVDNASNQFVCGTTDYGANDDMVVMKQNQYGTRLWVTTYNGTANENDTAISTMWMPNGFVTVTGRCREQANGNTIDATVLLMIDSGTVVWTRKFYGSDSLGCIPQKMITDNNGNIYICGSETISGGTNNGFIIKYDPAGNLLWYISYDAGLNLDDKFTSIVLDNNNDILVTGQSYSSTTAADMVTVKYANSVTGSNLITDTPILLAYPNPFHNSVTIMYEAADTSAVFSLYDIHGKLTMQKELPGNPAVIGEFTLYNKGLPGGIYFAELKSGNSIARMKLIMD
jgi:hypothetical protein